MTGHDLTDHGHWRALQFNNALWANRDAIFRYSAKFLGRYSQAFFGIAAQKPSLSAHCNPLIIKVAEA